MIKIIYLLILLICLKNLSVHCTGADLSIDVITNTNQTINLTTIENITSTDADLSNDDSTNTNQTINLTTIVPISSTETTTKPDAKDLCQVPLYSLNGKYNETELQSFESGIFIQQAFNFIFTGCYNSSSEIGNEFDNNTLDALLDGALAFYASELEKRDPENLKG